MPAPGVAVTCSMLISRTEPTARSSGEAHLQSRSVQLVHARPAVGGPGLSDISWVGHRHPCGSPSSLLDAAALGNPQAKL